MGVVRLAVASDIHFPDYGGALQSLTRGLAGLRGLRVDALILAGDFVAAPVERYVRGLSRLLRLWYRGPVYAVLGNHEHYVSEGRRGRGWDSVMVARWLEEVMCRHGITPLTPEAPVDVGGVSLVGVTGWYDYSFGPPGYSVEDYDRCNPYGLSVETLRDCERRGEWGASPWCPPGAALDCAYTEFPGGNRLYASVNLGLLERQLAQAEAPVVAVLHHAPHRSLLVYTGDRERDFYRAYDGSQALGDLLLSHGGVAAVVYGHLHEHSRRRIAWIEGVPHVNGYPAHPEAPGIALVEVEAEAGKARVRVHVAG